MPNQIKEFSQSFFHGTKADLKPGNTIKAGYDSNFGERKRAKYVYLTSNIHAAVWGAELAVGDSPGRIYVVEATGPIEDDPNLTDKKFPGNPTRSYRTRDPLHVLGEVTGWPGHSAEEIKARKDSLELALKNGAQIIED